MSDGPVSRFRFWSDANAEQFVHELTRRGATVSRLDWEVQVQGYVDGIDQLAQDLGGSAIEHDQDYATTSGLQDSSYKETPRASQGDPPPDYGAQIVGQMKRWPQRRKTRSQP
jgi:hypothetical protein